MLFRNLELQTAVEETYARLSSIMCYCDSLCFQDCSNVLVFIFPICGVGLRKPSEATALSTLRAFDIFDVHKGLMRKSNCAIEERLGSLYLIENSVYKRAKPKHRQLKKRF